MSVRIEMFPLVGSILLAATPALADSMTSSPTAAFATSLPNLSPNVEGTGVPGLDGGHWYLYNSPATWNGTPTFRSDRLATSGAAPTAGQANSWPWANIVAYNQTNASNIGFETGVLGWFDANANASTNAQQVTGEFVIVKQRWIPMASATAASGTGSVATITFSGSSVIPVGHTVYVAGMTPAGYNGYYKVTSSSPGSVSFASTTTGAMTVAGTIGDASISSAWGLNSNCTDATGEPDPIAACIGAEFDVQTTSNTTDLYRQRVGVQIMGASGHIGRGILMGTKAGATLDRAAEFDGTYGFGLDFTNGAFSGPVALLASNQTVAFDSNTSGVYQRFLGYNSAGGALQYSVTGNVAFSVNDSGIASANGFASNAGSNLILNAPVGEVVQIGINGASDVWTFDASGFYPTNDSMRTLGKSSLRWSNAYATNVTTSGLVAAGAAPNNSGTCSINNQVGGNTIGSFKANGACAGGTIVLTFATAAPNDWTCTAMDATTPADTIKQSNTTASATTATLTATMAAGDLVRFQCFAF